MSVREQSKTQAAEQRKAYQEKQEQRKVKQDAKEEDERELRAEREARQRAAEEATREEAIGRAHRMAHMEQVARARCHLHPSRPPQTPDARATSEPMPPPYHPARQEEEQATLKDQRTKAERHRAQAARKKQQDDHHRRDQPGEDKRRWQQQAREQSWERSLAAISAANARLAEKAGLPEDDTPRTTSTLASRVSRQPSPNPARTHSHCAGAVAPKTRLRGPKDEPAAGSLFSALGMEASLHQLEPEAEPAGEKETYETPLPPGANPENAMPIDEGVEEPEPEPRAAKPMPRPRRLVPGQRSLLGVAGVVQGIQEAAAPAHPPPTELGQSPATPEKTQHHHESSPKKQAAKPPASPLKSPEAQKAARELRDRLQASRLFREPKQQTNPLRKRLQMGQIKPSLHPAKASNPRQGSKEASDEVVVPRKLAQGAGQLSVKERKARERHAKEEAVEWERKGKELVQHWLGSGGAMVEAAKARQEARGNLARATLAPPASNGEEEEAIDPEVEEEEEEAGVLSPCAAGVLSPCAALASPEEASEGLAAIAMHYSTTAPDVPPPHSAGGGIYARLCAAPSEATSTPEAKAAMQAAEAERGGMHLWATDAGDSGRTPLATGAHGILLPGMEAYLEAQIPVAHEGEQAAMRPELPDATTALASSRVHEGESHSNGVAHRESLRWALEKAQAQVRISLDTGALKRHTASPPTTPRDADADAAAAAAAGETAAGESSSVWSDSPGKLAAGLEDQGWISSTGHGLTPGVTPRDTPREAWPALLSELSSEPVPAGLPLLPRPAVPSTAESTREAPVTPVERREIRSASLEVHAGGWEDGKASAVQLAAIDEAIQALENETEDVEGSPEGAAFRALTMYCSPASEATPERSDDGGTPGLPEVPSAFLSSFANFTTGFGRDSREVEGERSGASSLGMEHASLLEARDLLADSYEASSQLGLSAYALADSYEASSQLGLSAYGLGSSVAMSTALSQHSLSDADDDEAGAH